MQPINLYQKAFQEWPTELKKFNKEESLQKLIKFAKPQMLLIWPKECQNGNLLNSLLMPTKQIVTNMTTIMRHQVVIQHYTKKIAEKYSEFLTQNIDPTKNVYIGTGAAGVIFDFFSTLCNYEEEIIIFEPFYSFYTLEAFMAGAKPVCVEI